MKILLLLTMMSVSSFAQNNPVVIELFTSQGCSSCPAADKNLAKILEDSEKKGQLVYGLSFHVDYWNYIGWKDPYSKAEYTARQRKYSQLMNSEGVYTPQMIVNGRSEFVGSNKTESNSAVASALGQKNVCPIALNSIQQKEGKILVSYSFTNSPNELSVNVALVEKIVSNEVTRGENSGRKLTHRNVVRSFFSGDAKKEGTIEMEYPKGLSASSVIVFVQDKQWHILGASARSIN